MHTFAFSSLTTLINRSGRVLTEHRYLPTKEMDDKMEEFVQSMDLADCEVDSDGLGISLFIH